MQRTGKILTHTIIRVPPSPFKDEAPYAIAVVDMDDDRKEIMIRFTDVPDAVSDAIEKLHELGERAT